LFAHDFLQTIEVGEGEGSQSILELLVAVLAAYIEISVHIAKIVYRTVILKFVASFLRLKNPLCRSSYGNTCNE